MDKQLIERIAQAAYEEVMMQSLRPQDRFAVIGTCINFLARIDAERGKSAVAWIGQWSVDNLLLGCRVGGVSMSPQRDEEDGLVVPLYLAPTIPEGMALVPIELLKDLDGEHLANGDSIFFSEYIAAAQGEK